GGRADDVGNANATSVARALLVAQRRVQRAGQAAALTLQPAIIRSEDDNRVADEAQLVERVEHAADAGVEFLEQSGVRWMAGVSLDLRFPLVLCLQFRRRTQRDVHGERVKLHVER